jgi:hypothetical protein
MNNGKTQRGEIEGERWGIHRGKRQRGKDKGRKTDS